MNKRKLPVPNDAALRMARHSPRTSFDAGFLQARLADGIQALGLDVGVQTQQRLLDFLELLVKWNGVYNLTSVRDAADMVAVHLLDALSIVPIVDSLAPERVLDVGSGAGLPGIPLAVTRPGLSIQSVDAVAKKIAFQQQTKLALQLANFNAVHARVENLRMPPPGLIVSRAYADLARMLASIDHIAGPATTVLAMKAAVSPTELGAVPAQWTVVESRVLDVPYLGAERRVLLLARAGSARTEHS